MSDLILPESCVQKAVPRNAQLRIKVVFYRWPKKGNRLTVGFPDQFPAPEGAEKIVCNSAREVERWDAAMRQQDADDHEKEIESRENFEGPIRKMLREEMHHLQANARNQLNRDFMAKSIAKIEEKHALDSKETREGYMHAEAFESGH